MSSLIDSYPISSDIHRLLQNLLDPFSPLELTFAKQILASNLLQLNKVRRGNLQGWMGLEVELPSQTIDKLFGSRFSWKALDGPILTVSSYSVHGHACRRFVVKSEILDRVLDLSAPTTEEASRQQLVNLIDGSPYTRPAPHAKEFGVSVPSLVREAIRAFQLCPFDGAQLDAHVAHLKAAVEDPASSDDDRATAWRRYRNDAICAMRITTGCRKRDDGLFEYEPYYRPHLSGRLAEIGGGLQSCSRAMKQVALASVPNLFNYDLKASQSYVLLQELESASIDPDWLAKYLALEDGAREYASRIGVEKRTFKDCLYATIMGTPFNANHFVAEENAIYGALLDEVGEPGKAAQLMVRVHAQLARLRDLVSEWHRWLMESEACPHTEGKAGKRTLRNAIGNVLKLSELRPHEAKRKAAAHILQGQEARYIHELTVSARTHGFLPVSNQHDGIVTIGEVPLAAQDAAKTASGFRYARLEIKPFV